SSRWRSRPCRSRRSSRPRTRPCCRSRERRLRRRSPSAPAARSCGRAPSRCSCELTPAAMGRERELVKDVLGAARPLTVVRGLLALLELLDRLAVARGGGQHLAARVHLGVLTVEVERGLAAV